MDKKVPAKEIQQLLLVLSGGYGSGLNCHKEDLG